MRKIRRARELIPPWEMPSDPVKAVFWFFHWLLKLALRFFWFPILVMVIVETSINWRVSGPFNGGVSGAFTLLIGVGIWAALYVVSLVLDVTTGITRMISQVNRVRQEDLRQSPFYPFMNSKPEDRVVEGTITDLEEERRRRKRE